MNNPYPSNPREADGEIPEPLCYDVLRVFAEYGGAYLWDMNSVCISVSTILNLPEDHPLDVKFSAWVATYESKPLGSFDQPKWHSEEERVRFDRSGANLSKELYEVLGRKHTIVYTPISGDELNISAE